MEKKIKDNKQSQFKLMVRFFHTDIDETFDGTVIEETVNYYIVVPDDDLMLTVRWNKKRCDIIK